MGNFKTKPFSIIQPIPTTEIQRCNNNEIFHQLHLTKQKWLSPKWLLKVEVAAADAATVSFAHSVASIRNKNKKSNLATPKPTTTP
jgi:hypothetical protein